MKTKQALKEYRIDVGDSNTGPAGFVAYVEAKNERDALNILQDQLDQNGYEVETEQGFKVIVYLNADQVTIKDVDRVQ